MPSKKFHDEDSDEEGVVLAEPKNKILIERRRKSRQEKRAKKAVDEVEKIADQLKSFDPEEAASNAQSFDAFPLSSATKSGLRNADFTTPTDIQRLSLGHSLLGKDLVGAAKTGSGKTLALLIPLLECLWRNRWTKFDGLGALIITPTRELAYQIYQVLNGIGENHEFSVALLIGGTDVEFERNRLSSVNIVICTPGRLLQHMDENEHFNCDQLQMLVIDEADRILDMGFRHQMDAIIENLPAGRQSLLFSATQTRRVEDLVRVSLRQPVFVSAHEHASSATPDQLTQSYFVCEEEQKLNMLWSFLRNHRHKKSLIFVTCCKQARFLTEAFTHLRPGLFFTGLWGDLKQQKRMERFQRFGANTRGAAMICTDVASRGLDFEGLDWVLQMDCPASVDDYIHRVGRTARMDKRGEAMLMLTPSQEGPFLEMLQSRNVPIQKVRVDGQKVLEVRQKVANLMVPFPQLKLFAQSSFVAYARALYFMREKRVFDVKSINFEALANSYGLPQTPRIRFLKKQGIDVRTADKSSNSSKMEEEEGEEVVLASGANGGEGGQHDFNMEEDEAEEGEGGGGGAFLKLTRRDVFNSLTEVDAKEDVLARMSTKRAISKTEVAKKMLKRLGTAGIGRRRRFQEEEEEKKLKSHEE